MLMEQLHNYIFITRKWYFCFLLVSIFSGVTPSPTPDANLLCISECGTCPVICSPPPSPVESKPPPSPVESKPPPSPVESKPPPSPKTGDPEPPPYLTPIYHATPPPMSTATPMPRPPAKSCPPPSYIAMGTNAPPPPPPPPKLVVVPSTQIPSVEQKNYTYPYYYFYTSEGVAFSLDFSGSVIGFIFLNVILLVLG
ncbi:hypothetical protein L1887_38773 [Cichorium endivia]|nr:hypothetical protein L1887_38773 [Cichorium endivia]